MRQACSICRPLDGPSRPAAKRPGRAGISLATIAFCVLNARGTADKYKGGYETGLFKRMRDFVPAEVLYEEMERLFILFTLNCFLRNGDAHLKNFALIYDDVGGMARLAPVYDIVTTTVYIPKDGLALTLDGSTRWPRARQLTDLGTRRCFLTPRRVAQVFDLIATAVTATATEVTRHATEHPAFREVAERMLKEWACGVDTVLGGSA